ncbi:MAG: methylenetetrahydrofolate reductase C-terminal domain-containing protein [Planctomycetaceae bacterium]|jgi:methylenetetrahydrofolate reductase (NADPH)|nr:methylenetetrahydrofolate reductase C-terminal domain-containing protein [Planctomycetaceae bacterium]
MKKSFRQALSDSSFPIGVEIVTTRGIPQPSVSLPNLAKELLTDKRINYVSITDNPGGNPMLPPDWLARQLADFAPNLFLHLACKDYNRAGLESQLWRYAADGFENILALTGDLPTEGYPTVSGGVFDIDSVSLLAMMKAMNGGLPNLNRKRQIEPLPPTNFYAGAAVNPFKSKENELIPQYAKLLKKIAAGAQWIIPQLGYDMRKFADVQTFLAQNHASVPLIGNVYVLTKTAATKFNRNKLAGCVVADSLMQQIEKYAGGADKGKQFFKELATKQIAVFRGLGFAGVYLGGLDKPEAIFEIIDKAKSYATDDWKEFYTEIQYNKPDEFYYVQPDSTDSKKRSRNFFNVSLFYRFSRLVHAIAFHRGHGLYSLIKRFYEFLDRPEPIRRCTAEVLHQIEYSSKFFLYSCSDCGDCGLPDAAYLCPMNRCSKNQRNGPCGGSHNGRCEADDKDCLWTIVYDRLQHFDEWEEFVLGLPICYNAGLRGTSAWANLYLDRDHSAE